MVDYFTWAQNNLDVEGPHELQDRGVQVYFAPNIPPDVKLVDLQTGGVISFHPGQQHTNNGLYAQYSSLERYCREHDIPFIESGGQVSLD